MEEPVIAGTHLKRRRHEVEIFINGPPFKAEGILLQEYDQNPAN